MAASLSDRAALEIAYRELRTVMPLDAMLSHPALRIILENRARQHIHRRAAFDPKRLQANDNDL